MTKWLRLALVCLYCSSGCGFSVKTTESETQGVPGAEKNTFKVIKGKLIDSTNHEFVIRGLNMPFAYYFDRSFAALDVVKANQFNAVRIVWCADNLIRTGRCEPKDFRPIQELERVLSRMRELELVAVMNLQNATGSNDPGDLIKMSEWYMQEDVKEVLNRYKDMLIINIANEWYGAWDDPSNIYVDTYLKEISRLRQAGLDHTLVIDARGWGQQFSSIIETAKTLMSQDNNLLFSAHIYDIFSTPERVINAFNMARSMQIPLLIGEFACVHYPGQEVPCSTVMEQAEKGVPKVGTLAWSFSGNSNDLEGLNLYDAKDWQTLTPYGQQIAVTDPYSVAKTARTACLFPGQSCDSRLQL